MNQNSTKIMFTNNLEKTSFSSTFNIAIDSNVNIKTILNTHAYLYEEKIECGKGKAVISAKLGVKVLYIDTDGISNTLTDSISVSETISNPAITADSFINILNSNVVTEIISTDGVLKIACETTIQPVLYINIPLNISILENETLISKKDTVETNQISCFVNSMFKHTSTFETSSNISKVLCVDSYFSPTQATAKSNSIYVEGKLHCCLVYESNENDETKRKELQDTFNVATEIQDISVSEQDLLDLQFSIDKSKENISTDFEDNNSIVTISNEIKFCGVAIKKLPIEIVDDIFCTEHELNLSQQEREFTSICNTKTISDNVYGEVVLTDKENAIDEVISNLHITPEITNAYIKNDNLVFEGIISSHLCFVDETKQCNHKHLEIPFILNTKIELEHTEDINYQIYVCDCKIKVKRGTIIEVDYSIQIVLNCYTKHRKSIIDSVALGSKLNLKEYDYQIYLSHSGETMWELCKRIKISPEKLAETNKDLPLVMTGNEKVVIKR